MGQGFWSKMTGRFVSGEQSNTDEEDSARRMSRTDNVKFAVYMPSSYEDAARSAEAMKNGSGVVINGECLDESGYQRIVDFLDGAAYVLGGRGRRVSDNVQVYVPATLHIVDEVVSYYGNLGAGKKRTDV